MERSDGDDPSIAMPFVEAALLGKLQGWVSSGGLTVWLDSVVWWHTQHVGWAACIVKGDSVHLAAMDNTGSEMVLVDSAGRMCRMNTGEPLGAPREWQQLVEVSGTMHWLVSVAADCGSLLVVRQQEVSPASHLSVWPNGVLFRPIKRALRSVWHNGMMTTRLPSFA